MGLEFGYRQNDVRETIWKDDTALNGVTPGALEDWARDGDACHLRQFAVNGQPTVFEFRSLNMDESRWVMGMADGEASGVLRMWLACFRIGVRFPGAPEVLADRSTGQTGLPVTVREKGIRMMALPVVEDLDRRYPGMVSFYGRLIYAATFPSDQEKKASSPPSTASPSSAGEGTSAAGTAGAAATGA